MNQTQTSSLTTPPAESVEGAPSTPTAAVLRQALCGALQQAGGWLPFDQFMALALYAPGAGYYTNGRPKFGLMPGVGPGQAASTAGSDFVTAPELSPLFGAVLAAQVVQALQATDTREVWEFGAGSGALASQILKQTNEYRHADGGFLIQKYTIVDLSGELRHRQQQALAPWADRVHWAHELPPHLKAVVLGNEVLDAMPVKLLVRRQGQWLERGVVAADVPDAAAPWAWSDRPTALRPPLPVPGEHDYLTEIHHQAEGFLRTLADHLVQGAAFLLDYGFPEAEYYHPQRDGGTLMCHHLHQADANPLERVGDKDITAHVNFTGVALAAQEAGMEVLGYTTQGRFLINCGLGPLLDALPTDAHGLATRAMALKLVHEHEMGELFKVLAVAPAASAQGWVPMGFATGDRTHTL